MDTDILNNLAKRLNENCEYREVGRNPYRDHRNYEWETEDLNFNLDKCRDFCYSKYNSYDEKDCYILCDSCSKILKEMFGETIQKLAHEIDELRKIVMKLQKKLIE